MHAPNAGDINFAGMDTVLDFGCGCGRVLRHLRAQAASIEGGNAAAGLLRLRISQSKIHRRVLAPRAIPAPGIPAGSVLEFAGHSRSAKNLTGELIVLTIIGLACGKLSFFPSVAPESTDKAKVRHRSFSSPVVEM
jgi:hypothetical protein